MRRPHIAPAALLCLALSVAGLSAAAQDAGIQVDVFEVPPGHVMGPPVSTDVKGQWLVETADFEQLPTQVVNTAGGGTLVFFSGKPGTVVGVLFVPEGGLQMIRKRIVLGGTAAPVVIVKPPPVKPDVPEVPDEPVEPVDPPLKPAIKHGFVVLLTETPDDHADLAAALTAANPKVKVAIKTPAELPAFEAKRPEDASLPYAFLMQYPPGEKGKFVERGEYTGVGQVVGWLGGAAPATEIDRVVYVYHWAAGVPADVMAAIKTINADDLNPPARSREISEITGDGDTPNKAVGDAALDFGLPCLVLVSGDTARAIKAETGADLLEAIK